MMAEQRTARLTGVNDVGRNARLLRFASDVPLGFSGGQYVIVHTGIEIAGGKTAKRAYSMLSCDQDQHHFELAVRRIGAGPGSNFMHQLPVGSELSFTGPWGKFCAGKGSEPSALASPALIVATDTGITAAMGLLNSEAFGECAPEADVHWVRESDEYFLPESFVRGRIPGLCRSFTVRRAPPAHSGDRIDWLRDWLEEIATQARNCQPRSAFLSGDGLLVFAVRESLVGLGIPDIRVETFFNHQEKKTEVKAVAS